MHLPGIRRQRIKAAARNRVGQRQAADEQSPLVHRRRHERAERCVCPQPPRKHAGDEELRELRCQRRQPLHQQELVDAKLRSGADKAISERLRREKDRPAGV